MPNVDQSLVNPNALWAAAVGFAPRLVGAMILAIVFYLLWIVLAKALAHAARRTGADPTGVGFIEAILKFLLTVVGLGAALGQLGVDTSSLLASLGVAGLTIGFAARDTLSNLIAGMFIFWDRPFVIGDLVEIDGHYGRVDRITLRSTRVVTPDGRMLAIPNTTVVNSTVSSYTNFPSLRLDVPVTVGVGEDLGRVREVLVELCRGREGFLVSPPPEVVVTALNDYNVALEVHAWIEDEKQHIQQRHALREAVFEALRSAGVDMPNETLQLAPLQVRQVA